MKDMKISDKYLGLSLMRVGVICMKCSFPAGRTVWMVPNVVGVSSEEPIRILKLLEKGTMMIKLY